MKDNKKIKILISGEGEYFTDAVCSETGDVMVPAREFFEAMGAMVKWSSEALIMGGHIGKNIVGVKVDDERIVVNGQFVKVASPPKMLEDVMYIPVIPVAEGFGATVRWFEEAKSVCIWKKKEEKIELIKPQEKTIEEIWEIDIRENFLSEMSMYLSKKCNYGKDVEKLNYEQRVIYITQELEMEVNNGGFDQFFYNSGGNVANELMWAFGEIGATKTMEICKKAVSIFGDKVPEDREEREEALDSLGEEAHLLLNTCDDAFYEYGDNLTELNYQYILKNKKSFLN